MQFLKASAALVLFLLSAGPAHPSDCQTDSCLEPQRQWCLGLRWAHCQLGSEAAALGGSVKSPRPVPKQALPCTAIPCHGHESLCRVQGHAGLVQDITVCCGQILGLRVCAEKLQVKGVVPRLLRACVSSGRISKDPKRRATGKAQTVTYVLHATPGFVSSITSEACRWAP